MAITPRALIPAQQITASAVTYYTASKCTARVDNFTATNTTAAAHTLTVYLVASGGSASAANCIISAKSINAGETYNCPEMISKIIPDGSFIQCLADAGAAITVSAGGIEVT